MNYLKAGNSRKGSRDEQLRQRNTCHHVSRNIHANQAETNRSLMTGSKEHRI